MDDDPLGVDPRCGYRSRLRYWTNLEARITEVVPMLLPAFLCFVFGLLISLWDEISEFLESLWDRIFS